MNRAEIIGFLGHDPEVRSLQNGSQVCNLRVATEDRWTEKETGQRKSITTWHRIVIFNENLIGVAEQYLRKGSRVFIAGQLQARKWTDRGGTEHTAVEIVLQRYRGELELLDKREEPRDEIPY